MGEVKMRILSHQVHKHTNQGLPTKTENNVSYQSNSYKELLEKQAAEIQDTLTAKLEEEVEQK